jgi:hypothetical protein
MRFFLERITAVFFVLCITFIPLNFDGKGLQLEITQFLFHDFIRFLQDSFFENTIKNIDFSSDTIAFNLLLLVLFFVAIIVAFIIPKNKKIIDFSRTVVVYYLFFILLKYGFDKIFKTQFYLPEPNVLHTKFGDLSKDILYWSTMGTSRFYIVSLGLIEVFAAILLLINRTRVLGLLLAIGVFANVALINFGFDISVKTFSVFLFFATVFAIYPNLNIIFDFLIRQKPTQLLSQNTNFHISKPLQLGLKTFVVGMFLGTVLLPYIENQNFNDDEFPRPFFHGVYQVISSTQNTSDFQINSFYIHRKNYLILEYKSGKRIDYYFEIRKDKKQLKLINYSAKSQIITYNYLKKDSVLELNFPSFKIIAKAQNWQKMPALQNNFHWTIDEVK